MLFMSIKDGYASKKVTFETQGNLEEKIERLITMMSKLTAQDNVQNKQFKPKIYQSKGRGWTRNFYDRCDRHIKIDIDQIEDVREFHLLVGYNVDKTTGIGQDMIKTMGMILEEEILEEMWGGIRITEDNITEVDIEEMTEMIIMREVGVGPEKDSIKERSEEMTEVVVVDQGQVQVLVLIETGTHVTGAENMIILPEAVWL